MRKSIIDKEIIFTENTAKIINQNSKPTASIFTIYKKETNGEYTRTRERVLGNTVYTVIAHEKQNVGVTAFDITKTLIERNIDEALKPAVRITDRLSFESCNSGGNKQ